MAALAPPDSTAASSAARLVDYQLRLPMFEGPLDVLLRMIERSQLAIADVSLVAVTDQFVEYVSSLADVPTELLAEFTAMAARLVLLKSRSLLPAPPRVEEEPEPDDLTRQLLAYQAAKQAAEELRSREEAGLRAFARNPAPVEGLPTVERLASIPVDALGRALSRCLRRGRPAPKTFTPAPVITLAAMTQRLLDRLPGRARFNALLGEAPTRTERAVGFIALLTLLRRRVVDARQASLFGEIEVIRLAPEGVPADD